NLAYASSRRVRLQYPDRGEGVARLSQPQQRDIILRGSDASRVVGRLREGEIGFYQAGRRSSLDLGNPIRVDGRLAMLGGECDECRLQQALLLQFRDKLPNAGVDELDLALHGGGRGSSRIRIPAFDASFNEFLSNAHRLEVHTEQVGHGGLL